MDDDQLKHLVDALQRTPDAVVLTFLARLRERRDRLAMTLNGRSLRVEVVVVGDRRAVYRIVFTPAGHVELTGSYGFDPHVRFEGSPTDLVGLLLGTLDTFHAVYEGILTLYFPPAELLQYPAVRRLLAEELDACPTARV